MHIITLGTSHGDMTYCRYNSSTLLEECGVSYLIDAGSPADGQMVRCGRSTANLKAVFITHVHADHMGGLPVLIKAIVKHARGEQHCNIYLPEERALQPLIDWLDVFYLPKDKTEKHISFHITKKGLIYNDEKIAVSAIPTAHITIEGAKTYAFLVENKGDGKKILYSGDLRKDFSDFPDYAVNNYVDLCFCEATHYDPKIAIPMLSRCKFGRLIFNHVHNPWHGDGEKELLRLASPLPYPVSVAHDMDEFDL